MTIGGWIKVLIVTLGLGAGSAWAYGAGKSGDNLPGALDKPVKVDVRQGSASGRGRGATFIYFGSGRRYRGGGPSFGK